MYTMYVVNGDGATSSDRYVKATGEDLEQLKTKAPAASDDGWNAYCWIEDESGNTIWDRDFPVDAPNPAAR